MECSSHSNLPRASSRTFPREPRPLPLWESAWQGHNASQSSPLTSQIFASSPERHFFNLRWARSILPGAFAVVMLMNLSSVPLLVVCVPYLLMFLEPSTPKSLYCHSSLVSCLWSFVLILWMAFGHFYFLIKVNFPFGGTPSYPSALKSETLNTCHSHSQCNVPSLCWCQGCANGQRCYNWNRFLNIFLLTNISTCKMQAPSARALLLCLPWERLGMLIGSGLNRLPGSGHSYKRVFSYTFSAKSGRWW